MINFRFHLISLVAVFLALGGVALAFVRLKEDEYETRRVEVGASEGDLIEIKKGLRAGDEVVTQGSFLLKTETLRGAIGAGCCE